eukprot:556252_1
MSNILFLLVNIFLAQSDKYKPYIQEWVVLESTLPTPNVNQLAGYDQTHAEIHIIGGEVTTKQESILNINTNNISTEQVSTGIGWTEDQSYVTTRNKLNQSIMYFSFIVTNGDATRNNFYRFNIASSNAVNIEQIGLQYPKPVAAYDECFATDKQNKYIYLTGGTGNTQSTVYMNVFQIFDIETNTWAKGPSLNGARTAHGCSYFQNTDGNEYLFIFGGFGNEGSIEMLNVSMSNTESKWITLQTQLTVGARPCFAFVAEPLDIAYIIGYGLCNTFSFDSQKIQNCNKFPTESVQLFSGIFIKGDKYNFFENRFYMFGGLGKDSEETKIIQYAIICSSYVNLNESSNSVCDVKHIIYYPIKLPSECNYKISLINSNVFNFGTQLINNGNSGCLICNTSDCWNCTKGIKMKINYNQNIVYTQTNKKNIFYVDAESVSNNNSIAVNGFTVEIQTNFMNLTKSSTTISVLDEPRPIMISYILNYTEYVAIHLSSSTKNTFGKFENDLFINMNETSVIKCQICTSNQQTECWDCVKGINSNTIHLPSASTNVTYQNNENILNVDGNISNRSNNITIIGFEIIITDIINVTDSATSIIPGNSIPINISSFRLESNREYLFKLSSENQALSIDNILNITTGNDNQIIKCGIMTYNNPNSIDCGTGFTPTIDYQFVTSDNNLFNINVSLIHPTNKNIAIIPKNGIQVAIKGCSSGQGMENKNIDSLCNSCPYNEFTLHDGADPCIKCWDNLTNVECKGTDQIIVGYNYWISAANKDFSKYFPFYNITMNDSMFSSFCPAGFCCRSSSG